MHDTREASARLLIQHCEISENSAGTSGGGLHLSSWGEAGQINVRDCRISGNTAKHGGGGIVVNDPRGQCTVSNSVFSGNSSGKGKDTEGAILIDCTFEP